MDKEKTTEEKIEEMNEDNVFAKYVAALEEGNPEKAFKIANSNKVQGVKQVIRRPVFHVSQRQMKAVSKSNQY